MSRSSARWYQTVALRVSSGGGGPKPAAAGSPCVVTLTQPASNAVASRARLGRTRIAVPLVRTWNGGCALGARRPLYRGPGDRAQDARLGRVPEQLPDRRKASAGALLLAFGVGDRVGAVALQLGGRQFVQEPARRQPQLLAPALDFLRVRQPQRALGAGDADVEQAPLLVQPALLDAGLVRQVAVVHADDEHVAELQALGRVQAHQPHLVAGIALVRVRQQRQRRGEVAGSG